MNTHGTIVNNGETRMKNKERKTGGRERNTKKQGWTEIKKKRTDRQNKTNKQSTVYLRLPEH